MFELETSYNTKEGNVKYVGGLYRPPTYLKSSDGKLNSKKLHDQFLLSFFLSFFLYPIPLVTNLQVAKDFSKRSANSYGFAASPTGVLVSP